MPLPLPRAVAVGAARVREAGEAAVGGDERLDRLGHAAAEGDDEGVGELRELGREDRGSSSVWNALSIVRRLGVIPPATTPPAAARQAT